MSLSTLHVPVDQRQCRQTKSPLFTHSAVMHKHSIDQRSSMSSIIPHNRIVDCPGQNLAGSNYHVPRGQPNGSNCTNTEILINSDQMRMASQYFSAQLTCTICGGLMPPIHNNCLSIDNNEHESIINHNYPLSKTSNNPLLSEPPGNQFDSSGPTSADVTPISRDTFSLDLDELGTADGLLFASSGCQLRNEIPSNTRQHYKDAAMWTPTAPELLNVNSAETDLDHEMSLSLLESSKGTMGLERTILSDMNSYPIWGTQHTPRNEQSRPIRSCEPVLRKAIFTSRVLRSNKKDVESSEQNPTIDRRPLAEPNSKNDGATNYSRYRVAKKEFKLVKPKVFQRIEPKPESNEEFSVGEVLDHSAMMERLKHVRDSRDAFLIRLRLEGKSYKEIRRLGNFSEAESTLRGRFRTLIKPRKARVRRPEWKDEDLRLLREAVCRLTVYSQTPSQNRVPWKHVAEYIAENGGSYHFGNATCRKKWDELQEAECSDS